MTDYFEKHQERLNQAIAANGNVWGVAVLLAIRPRVKIHGDAVDLGLAVFQALGLNCPFEIDQPGIITHAASVEVSPYTQEPLGIAYPKVDLDALYEGIQEALPAWRDAGVRTRIGICMEMVERLNKHKL